MLNRVSIKRLFRRFKWILFYNWSSLTLNQYPYETCKYCGKCFHVSWNVDDKYWEKVVGVNDSGGGSLCIDCFIELANKKDVCIPNSAFKYNIFNPK